MSLRFEPSRLGGNKWAEHRGIIDIARAMSVSVNAYKQVFMQCHTLGEPNGYGKPFVDRMEELVKFMHFTENAEEHRQALVDGFRAVAVTYEQLLAEGNTSKRELSRGVVSGICEQVTYALLQKLSGREIIRDVIPFHGADRLVASNSKNLDFAAGIRYGRDLYWELFECKQCPDDFMEPYLWRNSDDPQRRNSWKRSQVRLALAILDAGTKFVSVAVVSFRPKPDVMRTLRRLEELPPGIDVYDKQSAWELLPWCQILGDA